MMANRALIDSSFLFTLYNQSDENYKKAQAFATNYKGVFIIPDVTLPEVTFLFARQGKTPAVIRFLKAFATAQPILEPLTVPDVRRAHEIMEKYADLNSIS
jgi:predicted nucleic acid-binding protein